MNVSMAVGLGLLLALLCWVETGSRRQLRMLGVTGGSRRRVGYDLLSLVLLGVLLLETGPPRVASSATPGLQAALVIDVSKSMAAGGSESRLQQALARARRWLEELPADRWCLIPFAGQPRLQVPATGDREAVGLILDMLEPGMLAVAGSDPEQAVALAQATLRQQGGRGVILLLSDGERTLSSPAPETAGPAPVYILPLGEPSGEPLPDPGGGWRRDDNGRVVLSVPDHRRLARIAEATGGRLLRDNGISLPAALSGANDRTAAGSPGSGNRLPLLLVFVLLLVRQLLVAPPRRWLPATLLLVACLAGSCRNATPETGIMELWQIARQSSDPDRRLELLAELNRQASGRDLESRFVARYNSGTLLLTKGQFHAALRELEQALLLRPGDPRASRNLALAIRGIDAAEPPRSGAVEGLDPSQPEGSGAAGILVGTPQPALYLQAPELNNEAGTDSATERDW